MVHLRATPEEASRLVVSSTFPAVTISYCLFVRPVDWIFICISVLASVLSINYWVYPIDSFRLYADISMSIVCVVTTFATGLLNSGWRQIFMFCCGLVCFMLSSYSWKVLHEKSNATERRSTVGIFLGPYWSYFHVTFHAIMMFPVNGLIQFRARDYLYDSYLFSLVGLVFVIFVRKTVNFLKPNLLETVISDHWEKNVL